MADAVRAAAPGAKVVAVGDNIWNLALRNNSVLEPGGALDGVDFILPHAGAYSASPRLVQRARELNKSIGVYTSGGGMFGPGLLTQGVPGVPPDPFAPL